MKTSNEIYELLKDFYNISGIHVSIFNTSRELLYYYPPEMSLFCRCVQSFPEFEADCIKSDAKAFEIVKETNEPYIYKCKFGLYEAVAPIYSFGKLTGFMMLGKVKGNDTKILKLALNELKNNGVDNNLLHDAYEELVSLNFDKLISYINIMAVLAEHFTKNNKLKSKEESLAYLVHKEVLNNNSKELSLSFLSKKFSCSISTLTASYKREYGKSIHQFIIDTRLEKATKLLKKSNKAVKEISNECGFYDQNHFYRTFKNAYKISPTEYRNNKGSST